MNNEEQTTEGHDDFFKPDEPNQTNSATELEAPEGVSWSASEFMHHQKTPSWYISVIFSLAVTGALSYFLMGELFGPVAIVVLGALMLIAASRKPRTLNYVVDSHGIVIGRREYVYDDFQSFAIVKEDSIESILLTPQKRWSPALTLYFDPSDGQKIFNVMSTYLPLEDRQKDNIDKFLHKIRF